MTATSLMLVAGEVSGDIHGGNLLQELLQLRPELAAFGVGGDRLATAGLECIERSEALAHMGIAEVVRELPRIHGILRRLIDESDRRLPSVAVLIDSPEFNLRLASHLVRRGVRVVLYVSPQLWAWRRGRVHKIRRLASEVLCILPFESEFYRSHGVPARFVGHPLVDDVLRSREPEPAARTARRLALLPGSRAMEISSLLPGMLDALARLPAAEIEEAVMLEAPGAAALIDGILERCEPDPRLRRVTGDGRRAALASSAVAWTASGTATLECALHDVPMVVGYRVHPLTALAARFLLRVPSVALVNLIAGRQVAPELLQTGWRPERLVATTVGILADGGIAQRQGLELVRRRLGRPGASRRAAEAVVEHLEASDPVIGRRRLAGRGSPASGDLR